MKVTYDTGALIAAERNDRRMWALHDGYNAEAEPRLSPPRSSRRHSGVGRVTHVAVVEVAIRRGDGGPVVTSNEAHIRQVANAAGVDLLIEQI